MREDAYDTVSSIIGAEDFYHPMNGEIFRAITKMKEMSNEAVDLSEDRLNRTGFFETVELDTKRAGNTPDTVNLDVKVKEQPTGSISGIRPAICSVVSPRWSAIAAQITEFATDASSMNGNV